jgi:DNA-directed RNA polymerase specialized sigma24 family protein
MDDIDDLRRLPDTYRDALLLAEAGSTHRRIAQILELPEEAVVGILELAQAKLARFSEHPLARPKAYPKG